jgi:hypothetical protein
MKTWLAGWLAVTVLVAGNQAMASGSFVVASEGDTSATSYRSDYSAMKVDSIIEKVNRFNTELLKGASTYSPDELRKLELKLKDTQEQLSVLTHGG